MTNKYYDGWKFTHDGRFPDAKLNKKWKKVRRKHQRTIEKRYIRKDLRKYF